MIQESVEGVLSYQIEVDGARSLESATKSTFTKSRLPQDTEHSLRVRAVRGSSVSEWGCANFLMVGRAQKKLFEISVCMEGVS